MGEPLVITGTVPGSFQSCGAAPLSCKCCSRGIDPCRFLPLFFTLQGRIVTPCSFSSSAATADPPSLFQQISNLHHHSKRCVWWWDLPLFPPCSVTPAVLCPSSVDWEGQPGPCPGTGSSSAAHAPQVKQPSTRNGVGQAGAGISVDFSTM